MRQNPYRTAGVEAVLDIVRDSGKSAHEPFFGRWSYPVLAASLQLNVSATDLQAQVEKYADWEDENRG